MPVRLAGTAALRWHKQPGNLTNSNSQNYRRNAFEVFNQTKKIEEAELDIIKLQKIRPSKQHLIVFHCCSALARHLKHRIFQPCSASTALAAAMALAAKSAASLWALVNSNCNYLDKIFENISKHLSKNSKSFPICHLKDLVCFEDSITLNLSEDC